DPGRSDGMFYSLLPGPSQVAMSDYLRHRVAALRRATPGSAPMPVYRPAASRFLIAGLCAWVLWQPLKGSGAEAEAVAPTAIAVVEQADGEALQPHAVTERPGPANELR